MDRVKAKGKVAYQHSMVYRCKTQDKATYLSQSEAISILHVAARGPLY